MKKKIVYDRNRFPASYVQYNTFAACCPLLLYGISEILYGVFCAKIRSVGTDETNEQDEKHSVGMTIGHPLDRNVYFLSHAFENRNARHSADGQ